LWGGGSSLPIKWPHDEMPPSHTSSPYNPMNLSISNAFVQIPREQGRLQPGADGCTLPFRYGRWSYFRPLGRAHCECVVRPCVVTHPCHAVGVTSPPSTSSGQVSRGKRSRGVLVNLRYLRACATQRCHSIRFETQGQSACASEPLHKG
jgi:hypothetical protein